MPDRLASLGIMEAPLRLPLKPLNTIVLWCTGAVRGPSNMLHSWCRGTPVSRTAISLIDVVFLDQLWIAPVFGYILTITYFCILVKDGRAFHLLFNLKNAIKYMRTLGNYMNILQFSCFDLAINCCSFLLVYWSILVKYGPVFDIPTTQVE